HSYKEARNSFQGVATNVSVAACPYARMIMAAVSTSFGSAASTMSTTSVPLFLLLRQEFLFNRRHNHIIRINHLIQMDSRNLGQQFVTVQLGEAVIVVNPCHQLCKRDAQAVIQWPVGPHGHDSVLNLKGWPADLLSLDHVNLQPPTQWNFNRRACHFAVAHSGMPIPHVELRSQHIYGKVDGVAGASLRRVHVAAESLRHDGTACLPARWCHADPTKERMQRN